MNDIAVTSSGSFLFNSLFIYFISGEIWIGSENGLFYVADQWHPNVVQIDNVTEPVNAVAVSQNDEIVVGTDVINFM